MKKYLFILLASIASAGLIFLVGNFIFAQTSPSFEIYCNPSVQNCAGQNTTPYPLVKNATVSKPLAGNVTITADVTDVSGVSSVYAVIRKAGVQVGSSVAMNFVGGASGISYGGSLNISDPSVYLPGSTYTVDIIAIDTLLNSSYYSDPLNPGNYINAYSNVGNFVVSTATLQSIAITTPPNKLIYYVGDSLDVTGMIITGTYADGSTQIEPVTTSNVSGFSSASVNPSETLTVTVYGKTATYPISVISGCQTSGVETLCIQSPTTSAPTTITSFYLSDSNISAGVTISANATLSSAVSGETITFTDLDAGAIIGSAQTVSGFATYSFTPSFSGSHRIEAIYSGNSALGLAPSYDTVILFVSGNCQTSGVESLCIQNPSSSYASMLSFNVVPDVPPANLSDFQNVCESGVSQCGTSPNCYCTEAGVGDGDPVIFSVTLHDSNGNPISGKKVTFMNVTNNAIIFSAYTNSNGIATNDGAANSFDPSGYNPSHYYFPSEPTQGINLIQAIFSGDATTPALQATINTLFITNS